MKAVGFIIFIGFLSFQGLAQNNQEGSLQIIQDSRVDTLFQKYLEVNNANPGVDGWRIEIFFEAGNFSKKLAMEAKSEFVEVFPDMPVYVIFQQPYYKVRVGDFRTRLKAEEFMDVIKSRYPNAFVVKDYINFPKLN